MGKYNEAISLYNQAIQKNPDYNTARKNLKTVLSELPLENKITPVISESSYEDIQHEKVSPIENNSKPHTHNPNFFEELTSIFSSIGSLFGFQN